MAAIGPTTSLIPCHVFRSVLRPERPVRNSSRDRRRRRHPWPPALRVVGHMAATTFVFTSFVTLVWLASWGFSFLHSIHALSDEVLQLLETLETVLIYLDAALCVVVVLRGFWQYVRSVIRGDS